MKIVGFIAVVLLIASCTATSTPQLENIATATPFPVENTGGKEPVLAFTETPKATVDPFMDWQIYTNENYKISIKFPPAWFGPDVYEVEDEIRLAIGSDIVFPYGTDRTEQIYDETNSYYITIQYRKNPGYVTLEEYSQNQPWLNTYLELLSLKDGESISSARAIEIREREIQIGRFSGLEYIATLPGQAQTEHFYGRQVILFDDELNSIMILGSPNNVEIGEDGNWREAYQNLDQAYKEIFDQVLEFMIVE